MRDFIRGFTNIYKGIFDFFVLDKEDLGALCAVISIIIIVMICFSFILKACYSYGRMEVRKAYQVEVKYEQPKMYENSSI